jgi:uncharacterized protein YlxW (UPF0749 family)
VEPPATVEVDVDAEAVAVTEPGAGLGRTGDAKPVGDAEPAVGVPVDGDAVAPDDADDEPSGGGAQAPEADGDGRAGELVAADGTGAGADTPARGTPAVDVETLQRLIDKLSSYGDKTLEQQDGKSTKSEDDVLTDAAEDVEKDGDAEDGHEDHGDGGDAEDGHEDHGDGGDAEDGDEDGGDGEVAGKVHRLEPLHSIHFWGASPAGLLIGLLLALLGFGLVVQLQSNTGSGLATRRQDDLVRILDNLSSQEERLRQQIADLNQARDRLTTGGDNSAAALAEAKRRSDELGILAGTLAAQGPGIQMTITSPDGKVTAEDLLDAIEELRGAGAEAISVGPARIGLSSAFTQDTPTSPIVVDGRTLTAPYVFLVIGDPPTLATAMNIPGGVVDTVRTHNGETRIVQRNNLVIRVLRDVRAPQYAQPSPTPTN